MTMTAIYPEYHTTASTNIHVDADDLTPFSLERVEGESGVYWTLHMGDWRCPFSAIVYATPAQFLALADQIRSALDQPERGADGAACPDADAHGAIPACAAEAGDAA